MTGGATRGGPKRPKPGTAGKGNIPVSSASGSIQEAADAVSGPPERKVPGAPKDLARRGRAFWRQIVAVFELSDVEMELLRECCRLLDESESLRDAIRSDGTTVPGSAGQVRVHPALGELRQHRLALGKLLAQLSLPDVDDSTLASPTSARARKAAQSRWAQRDRQAANG